MSLYSYEEICGDCVHAVFHYCDKCQNGKSFCHCKEDKSKDVDHSDGSCEHRLFAESLFAFTKVK